MRRGLAYTHAHTYTLTHAYTYTRTHIHTYTHTHIHTHTRTRTQVQDTKLLHVAQALLALPQQSLRVYAAIADPLDMMLAQELVSHRQGGETGAEAAGVGLQHKAQHNAQQLELVCVCVCVCVCVYLYTHVTNSQKSST